MTLNALVTWILVGLVAGWLASVVIGSGYGLVGDIVIGIVGSILGGWIFRSMHVHSPLGGLAGTILVAFVGAVVLLFLLRILRGTLRRPP